MKKRWFLLVVLLFLSGCKTAIDSDCTEICKYIDNNDYSQHETSYANNIKPDFMKSWRLGYTEIATRGLINFIITQDDVLWQWRSAVDAEMPTKLLDEIIKVVPGLMHELFIGTDNTLWGRGSNNMGEIGDGTTEGRWTPIQVMENVISAAAGGETSFAIKSDGSLWAWGLAERGRLGDGTSFNWNERNSAIAIQPEPKGILQDVVSVAAGERHGMALKADGSLWTWGPNCFGVIGNGKITVYELDDHIMVLKEDNDVLKPIKVKENIVYIAAGNFTSFAIDVDGNLWGWGNNMFGQLGNGALVFCIETSEPLDYWQTTPPIRYIQPMPVKILDDVVYVAAAFSHTFAIKSDGSLWGWGANSWGQLGDGTTTNTNVPVKIMGGVTSIATAPGRSLAIRSDGSLWGWGNMLFGENGEEILTPIEITYGMLIP